MKKIFLFLVSALLFSKSITAQSLAINNDGTTADPNAIVDIKSTTKGLLIPRMSKTERNSIASPAAGLIVFQNAPDSAGFYYYDGSTWNWVASLNGNADSLAWKRNGNAGTNATKNFIGTTDSKPLRFRVSNIWAGEIDSTRRSVFFGLNAGLNGQSYTKGNIAIGAAAQQSNSFGSSNISIGDSAFYNNTASFNTISIGNKALFNSTSVSGVTAIGDSVMYKAVNPFYVTAVGAGAGFNTSYGYYNTAIGFRSMYKNTSGMENTFVGHVAGYSNTTSGWETAIGDSALYSNTGDFHHSNTALGAQAGTYNTGSSACIYIGFRAGYQSSGGFGNILMGTYAGEKNSGDNNVAIGQQSMRYTSGDNNVALGYGTLQVSKTGANNTALGSSALGNDTTGNSNVAVGNSAMYYHLRNNFNTAVGTNSLFRDSTGTNNTAVGYNAMTQYHGDNNTALGTSTLDLFGSGTNNTAIGYLADVGIDNLANATAIGAFSRCDTSNSIVLGSTLGFNSAPANANVGISTTKPKSRMDVNGSMGLGIRTITASTSLNEADHTVIILNSVGTGTVAITLPTAFTCSRREYRIVNQNVATNKSVSTYIDFTGASVTTIPANNTITIQSNGTSWYRVQ